jgi:hypothetical protein
MIKIKWKEMLNDWIEERQINQKNNWKKITVKKIMIKFNLKN